MSFAQASLVVVGTDLPHGTESDVLVLRCTGDVSPEDAAALLDACRDTAGRFLVLDVTRLGQIGQEARRLLAQGELLQPTRFGIVGGSFRSRVVITSLLAERGLLPQALFFQRIADAVAWVRQNRDTIDNPGLGDGTA